VGPISKPGKTVFYPDGPGKLKNLTRRKREASGLVIFLLGPVVRKGRKLVPPPRSKRKGGSKECVRGKSLIRSFKKRKGRKGSRLLPRFRVLLIA